MTINLTRRQALAATAAIPAAAAFAPAAMAGGHAMAPSPLKARQFKLGSFEVTTLLSGSALRDNAQGIFGMNVSPEEFATVSEDNFISNEAAQFYFTPTLVKTGAQTILFDTGLNPDGITAALADAGTTPDDITHVVLTHMHGDHIGGMAGDAGETFKNAAYITGRIEYDTSNTPDNENFQAKVAPYAERFTFLEAGQDVITGITSMDAFGHTPGHMGYMLESDGQQLMLIADTANHYVWSLGYPDWEVRFDRDKAAAAATRRKILGMLAADKTPFIGYHMPFPALGYVAPRGEGGFTYVPHSYQLMG
jgi:glyoxylase-like metal-dependent hydrolase (beta-lactamase superfamily II)